MEQIVNPRSVLHALAPLGAGTAEAESLTSYLCRLAVSHSTSTTQLSRWICEHFELMLADDFDWHARHISGIGQGASRWAAALSALTAVEEISRYTFLPWAPVIASNGLAIHRQGQYCPQCLLEDRQAKRTPYLRLAWEPKIVSVCNKHRIPLATQCRSCGKQNIRHAAAFVVPGWCASCGEFLGNEVSVVDPEPWPLRVAEQVSMMIQRQQCEDLQLAPLHVHESLRELIDVIHGGVSSAFSRYHKIPKTTVHHWMRLGGLPSLKKSLELASETGFDCADFLMHRSENWKPPVMCTQQVLELDYPVCRRKPPRSIEWEEVTCELEKIARLPTPIPVLEAAAQLNVEARQLYLHCNKVTRLIGERWKAFSRRRQQAFTQAAIPHLQKLSHEMAARGKTLSMRDARAHVPPEILNKVVSVWNVIREVNGSKGDYKPDPANEATFANS